MSFSVVYTIDKAYQIPLCCSLTSLLDHNLDIIDEIFVVQNETSSNSENFKTLKSFIYEKYHKTIQSVVIDEAPFEKLRTDYHISSATYYRLCVPDYISNGTDVALLIDPDTIITGRLDLFSELKFAIDDDIICHAVHLSLKESITERLSKFCPDLTGYLSAGVIFANFRLWRAEKLTTDMMEFAHKHHAELKFMDQDILSIYFNGRTRELPYTYNASHITKKLIDLPKVVHYTGNRKPWHYICLHPYKHLYWAILKKTPFGKFGFIRQNIGKLITWTLKPMILYKRKITLSAIICILTFISIN